MPNLGGIKSIYGVYIQKMSSFIQTRIIPPKLPQKIIHREALLDLLNENSGSKLILICAPAGYGKTTLVQDYLNERNKHYSWLYVNYDMDNFYTFINYFVNSLKQVKPEFGSNTFEVIERSRQRYQLTKNQKTIFNDVIGTFVNEFCMCFSEEFTAVIDDLGNIENSQWLGAFFDLLFQNLPSNLHIIITSREVPKFDLSSLQVKREILKLDINNLTFKTAP